MTGLLNTIAAVTMPPPDNNLTILAFEDPASTRTSSASGSFKVDFNPNNFTINNKIEFQKPKEKGTQGGDPVFENIAPLEFSLEFTIDGTGVAAQNLPGASQNDYKSQRKEYVKNRVKKLRSVTGCNINSDLHRPNYLAVLWGTFYIECVLSALNITYNLFSQDGTPLRAKINCSFIERVGPDKKNRTSSLESPDLTKHRLVLEGDRLPFIVKKNYDESAYYIQVAKANKLKSFRKLVPGTRLVLPAMKKN
jgi:nucleoid-associated protein YgaU